MVMIMGKKAVPLIAALALLAVASDQLCFPGCRKSDWHVCMHDKTEVIYPTHDDINGAVCMMCTGDHSLLLGTSCFNNTPVGFAVRGHPFNILSEMTSLPLDATRVLVLHLVHDNITDVDMSEPSLSGYTNLIRLDLGFNKFRHVRQSWFRGLEALSHLILSNSRIDKIDPGCFADLTRLVLLNLDHNLLQVVDPDWFLRSKILQHLYLSSNSIERLPADALQYLPDLRSLDMGRNPLSCLHKEAVCGMDSLRRLHLSSDRMLTMHGGTSGGVKWSLLRKNYFRSGELVKQRISFEVPHLLLCLAHDPDKNEQSLKWMFGVSSSVPRHTNGGFPDSCMVHDASLSLTEITMQPPFVAVAQHRSSDKQNRSEQCRQMWGRERDGLTVGLKGGSNLHIVSIGAGDAAVETVALMVDTAQNTGTHTATDTGKLQAADTYPLNTYNGNCILLTKYGTRQLHFGSSKVGTKPQKTCSANGLDMDQASYTKSKPQNQTTPRLRNQANVSSTPAHLSSTLPNSDHTGPSPGHLFIQARPWLIPAVVSVVGGLALLPTVWFLLKKRRLNNQANKDVHVWVIPNAFLTSVARPRAASLPLTACSGRKVRGYHPSRWSLPADLHSIEPTYSEIPDDRAAAQRPLPALPHTYDEIPDDAIPSLVRSASVPTTTAAHGEAISGVMSHRSLPSRLHLIEPTYSEIPAALAAAQRPLPALPRAYIEVPDDVAAARRSLPARFHTYSEILDEDSGPMPFYAQPAAVFYAVTNRGRNIRTYQNNAASRPSRHQPGRRISMYGTARQTKGHPVPFYRNMTEVHGMQTDRQPMTSSVSQPTDQCVRVCGTRNTPRRASLPHVTLPNTYWPWDIPGEGTPNTPQRTSLPLVTLPNTYWPWDIPGKGTRNTPQRTSLPLVTLPNTYWQWDIPGEGASNTPRRTPLPNVTLPNTYWPWDIPGEGTRNTPRRTSLPLVTLPNTYWPWEIPGEGTRNTPRRAPLPLVTLPNTSWPWDIPGEGTPNTPRRTSLPLVTLPNTYWQWDIPGEGASNTPRRTPLPHVTLPNTYWPWEIPGKGTPNTPQRTSLPLVTLPNTYWPWDIPGDGTPNTPRCAPLPNVTLPNTYWPWDIPGEGTPNTPRCAPLPNVTLPNTYWPWDIPGEGTPNTPRCAPLPNVTLPNTYWPWDIPGEGTPNTPRCAPLPNVTLPNTYWPWDIPGKGTPNTPRCAPLPNVTLPNTSWPWDIPGKGTPNTPQRASLPNVKRRPGLSTGGLEQCD
ncbi:LRIG2 [Branchiostoma lanceolatum]|uniref:LRIG2 protein n=1 Tax=Branchiostoma lanceolatum TaxID=7740 RepID=A0A8J9ZPX2_BRALA|nr:LRIG2 [Branchiostoma lanceolatum]